MTDAVRAIIIMDRTGLRQIGKGMYREKVKKVARQPVIWLS